MKNANLFAAMKLAVWVIHSTTNSPDAVWTALFWHLQRCIRKRGNGSRRIAETQKTLPDAWRLVCIMYYVAYKRMQHEQDAEDVVHHVFVKIAENIKNIEPVSPKTKQLIVTMFDNRVTDVFRVRGKHPVVMYDDELKNSPVTENEREDLLTECILKLPEQQRMVIWMKYKQGYSLREIAKALDISLVWAQKIDQRAKKKLEELYLEGGGIL